RASLLAALERAADVRAVDCQAEWRRETVEAVKRGLDAAASTESERLGAEAKGRARTLLGRVINRYDGVSHLERISNSFTLNERLPDAVAEAFPELTGCTVETQSNPCSVVLRSDDPLSRELGRRVLRQLNNHRTEDGDAFRTLVRETRSSLEGEVRNAGAKAVRALGLTDVGAEIQDLLGRLKFRLSFSQNQWKHSIEVAHLAGILARELDLDQTPARRAGLMHDMGKALTHEREEAHAIVGAEIAARNGESEEVRHAIGAHHYDEAPSSALAFLIIAADAMSGARPGARRDTTSQYAQRVRDIEKIARREPGVARVDVMKGGREVWVTVAGDESSLDEQARSVRASVPLPDEEVQPTARRIACAISDELVFAGQIRVTVIRESRAVSVVRS
ncbi:MAG: HDIG domain-containing metalloprotein, partial [Myxococcota bacterium]